MRFPELVLLGTIIFILFGPIPSRPIGALIREGRVRRPPRRVWAPADWALVAMMLLLGSFALAVLLVRPARGLP
jgi:hypothetical protein